MQVRPLALGTQSVKGYNPLEGVSRLINARIEITGEESKRNFVARATPGLASVGSFSGTGGVRGMLEVDGIGIGVIGRTIQQFNAGELAARGVDFHFKKVSAQGDALALRVGNCAARYLLAGGRTCGGAGRCLRHGLLAGGGL